MAMWAVLLGCLLVLVAATSSHAALVRGNPSSPPAAGKAPTSIDTRSASQVGVLTYLR